MIQHYALIPLSSSQHFSPLGTSPNLVKLFSFKLEWRALLTNSEHHKPVTPSYYLGTFQTVLEMQNSGTVFLLQCYHSTCKVSQRCKTALENIRKTATFAYTSTWKIQGCSWGRNQSRGKYSQSWVEVACQVWGSLPAPVLPLAAAAAIGGGI